MFRELLKKIILNDISRVNVNNLEKTERSFIDDSHILQEFINSNDPYIIAFKR